MKKTYGSSIKATDLTEWSSFQVTLNPEEFNIMWRHCDIFSKIITDYISVFLQEKRDSHLKLRNWVEIKGSVAYIGNELLENSLKFRNGGDTVVKIQIFPSEIMFSVTNVIHKSKIAKFQELLEYYQSKPLDELLLETMEKNAESQSSSSIGLLTMMNDYHAQLSWQFDELSNMKDFITVTTVARLSIVKD